MTEELTVLRHILKSKSDRATIANCTTRARAPVITVAFGEVADSEPTPQPRLVFVDADNMPKALEHDIAVQRVAP